MKVGVREHSLYDSGISGQARQVHSNLERKSRDDSGHGPPERHQHGRYPKLAQWRGSGNHPSERIRAVQGILEHNQSAEAVTQQK
jgi:hypothetical protein